jgi:hypothetical protein
MLEAGWPAPRRRLHRQPSALSVLISFTLVGAPPAAGEPAPEPSLGRCVPIHAVPKSAASQIGLELTPPLAAASALTRTSRAELKQKGHTCHCRSAGTGGEADKRRSWRTSKSNHRGDDRSSRCEERKAEHPAVCPCWFPPQGLKRTSSFRDLSLSPSRAIGACVGSPRTSPDCCRITLRESASVCAGTAFLRASHPVGRSSRFSTGR